MNNVSYFDSGKASIHEAFAECAEDAAIDGAVILVKRGDAVTLHGGNLSLSEMALASMILDEVTKGLIFDDGE